MEWKNQFTKTTIALTSVIFMTSLMAFVLMPASFGGGGPFVLDIDCSPSGASVTINNSAGTVSDTAMAQQQCKVNGTESENVTWTPGSDLEINNIESDSNCGQLLDLILFDGSGNSEYTINGANIRDSVTYIDGAGKDKLVFRGKQCVDFLQGGTANNGRLTMFGGNGNDHMIANDLTGPGKYRFDGGNQHDLFEISDSFGGDQYNFDGGKGNMDKVILDDNIPDNGDVFNLVP